MRDLSDIDENIMHPVDPFYEDSEGKVVRAEGSSRVPAGEEPGVLPSKDAPPSQHLAVVLRLPVELWPALDLYFRVRKSIGTETFAPTSRAARVFPFGHQAIDPPVLREPVAICLSAPVLASRNAATNR